MPLFLIFYHDQRGYGEHSVMLCSYRKLRKLLRQFKGFETPDDFGKILYTGSDSTLNPAIRAMLKQRYDFDLDKADTTGARSF